MELATDLITSSHTCRHRTFNCYLPPFQTGTSGGARAPLHHDDTEFGSNQKGALLSLHFTCIKSTTRPHTTFQYRGRISSTPKSKTIYKNTQCMDLTRLLPLSSKPDTCNTLVLIGSTTSNNSTRITTPTDSTGITTRHCKPTRHVHQKCSAIDSKWQAGRRHRHETRGTGPALPRASIHTQEQCGGRFCALSILPHALQHRHNYFLITHRRLERLDVSDNQIFPPDDLATWEMTKSSYNPLRNQNQNDAIDTSGNYAFQAPVWDHSVARRHSPLVK